VVDANADGPVHEYVGLPEALVAVTPSVSIPPVHAGELDVIALIEGRACTTTFTTEAVDVAVPTVAVTLYAPLFDVVAFAIFIVAVDALKLPGPVQLKEAVGSVLLAVSIIESPEQYTESPDIVGAAGV
jgi:hypothetical protein